MEPYLAIATQLLAPMIRPRMSDEELQVAIDVACCAAARLLYAQGHGWVRDAPTELPHG